MRAWISAAAAIATLTYADAAEARDLRVKPGGAPAAVAAAAAGDTVTLAAGTHAGPLRVDRAILLRGEPGAVLDGGGHGTVLRIDASGARVEDLTLRRSGSRVLTIDSGIHVVQAANVALRRLRLSDVLYGVYAERASALTVADCRLLGRVTPLDESGEGNGIHLWYCDDATIAHNDVSRFVDAVYLSFARATAVTNNHLHDSGRYGLHTMYCQDNRLLQNRFTRNVAGCAIMFSNHLMVRGNAFIHNRGSRTYGILLRDCSDGEFADNRLIDNTIAVFMDGSNRNRIRGNLVQDNGWGLLLFSSCDGNVCAGNSFINNDYPVALDMKYSDNRFDDGSYGNYWSENAPYDLNADGVSDIPYSPVTTFAFLSKQYPDLTILGRSPAVTALGVAERVLPALRPSEAVDHAPLVAPPRAGADAADVVATRPSPAWGALVGFGALAGVGVVGLAGGRRRP